MVSAIGGLVDGRPIEGDVKAYVVINELDSSLVKIVESTDSDIVSEIILLELQLRGEGFKAPRTILQEQQPVDMEVLRVSTDILSRNHRKSYFVWSINSQDPTIRRTFYKVITFKGMTITKAGRQVLKPECLVRTVLLQHHERWGHPAGERLLNNLKQRYYRTDISSDAHAHAETCDVCQRNNNNIIAGQLKCLNIL